MVPTDSYLIVEVNVQSALQPRRFASMFFFNHTQYKQKPLNVIQLLHNAAAMQRYAKGDTCNDYLPPPPSPLLPDYCCRLRLGVCVVLDQRRNVSQLCEKRFKTTDFSSQDSPCAETHDAQVQLRSGPLSECSRKRQISKFSTF